jgi:hypothetical protein
MSQDGTNGRTHVRIMTADGFIAYAEAQPNAAATGVYPAAHAAAFAVAEEAAFEAVDAAARKAENAPLLWQEAERAALAALIFGHHATYLARLASADAVRAYPWPDPDTPAGVAKLRCDDVRAMSLAEIENERAVINAALAETPPPAKFEHSVPLPDYDTAARLGPLPHTWGAWLHSRSVWLRREVERRDESGGACETP